MKILVTGANGQLGTEIRNIAGLYDGCEFVFTDVEELDITDGTAVRAAVNGNAIDLVINCAAYTAVDRAETDEPRARVLNGEAPVLLAKAMADLLNDSEKIAEYKAKALDRAREFSIQRYKDELLKGLK